MERIDKAMLVSGFKSKACDKCHKLQSQECMRLVYSPGLVKRFTLNAGCLNRSAIAIQMERGKCQLFCMECLCKAPSPEDRWVSGWYESYKKVLCNKCSPRFKVGALGTMHEQARKLVGLCAECAARCESFTQKWEDEYKRSAGKKEKRRSDKLEKFNQLRTGSCVRCGASPGPGAMSLVHRPDTEKRFNLDARCLYRGIETLTEEARKCDLVCANCLATPRHILGLMH